MLLWAAALFFSGSRTALLFGGVMLLLGMAYLVWKKLLPLWALFVILAAAAAIALLLGHQLHELFFGSRGEADGALVGPHETRWALLAQAWKDFRQHPLLGIGLGSQKNAALFTGVPGSMVFYHNAAAQVLGSMGLAGAAAYGLLLVRRVRLLLRGGDACLMLGMFYLGMLLVSMTNPGLFCPLPNAALTVLAFAVLEKCVGSPARPLFREKK